MKPDKMASRQATDSLSSLSYSSRYRFVLVRKQDLETRREVRVQVVPCAALARLARAVVRRHAAAIHHPNDFTLSARPGSTLRLARRR